MSYHCKKLILTVISTLVNLGIVAGSTCLTALAAGPPEFMKEQLLRKAILASGAKAEELTVNDPAVIDFPAMGFEVFKAKVMNQVTGDILSINLDESGAVISEKQLREYEAVFRARPHGNIHPRLAERLTQKASKGKIKVIIWLKEPNQSTSKWPESGAVKSLTVNENADSVFARADAERAAAVTRVTMPVVKALGKFDAYTWADRYSPAVYAILSPAAIQEVARRPEVADVYEDSINKPTLEIARATIKADVVNRAGITGSGIRVAQIEVGGRVQTRNPYLAGLVQDQTTVCPNASTHSTGVAGIIRSTNSSRRGIASRVTLRAGGSCTGDGNQLMARATAAANWGARVLNLSFGSDSRQTPDAAARFYDDMVFRRLRTVVVAAGNEAGPCESRNGNVISPGVAYDVITVGNFDDRNTIAWGSDVMSACSSWRDPKSTHNDREKPEVAAPGSYINSTTIASPWIGGIGSGTSYAAPAVTGVVALLMQRNIKLQTWPEAVKAILMTTAIHNIEGSARLSERDGAGGIAADRAITVASANRNSGSYGWAGQPYSCSAATKTDVAKMSLTAGLRTRATIVWHQNPGYVYYANRPSADLDLQVISPSNTVVASSVSWDNTFEIVDFIPRVSGIYKLRVNKTRCDLTPAYLGYAWRAGN